MRFQPLEKLINLHDGYRRRIKIDALDVLVIQASGVVYVVQGRCPHQEQSLEQADVEQGVIYCPRHGYGFSLISGAQLDAQCPSLQIYTVAYEGTEMGIVLDD